MKDSRKRYIGLDVHKHYFIAIGVNDELNVVLPARRVELSYLEAWMKKTLTRQDEVVLEMTTNTWQLDDELCVCWFCAGGTSPTCRLNHQIPGYE